MHGIGTIDLLIVGVIAFFLLRRRLSEVARLLGQAVEDFHTFHELRFRNPVEWRRLVTRLQLRQEERNREIAEDMRRLAIGLLVAAVVFLIIWLVADKLP